MCQSIHVKNNKGKVYHGMFDHLQKKKKRQKNQKKGHSLYYIDRIMRNNARTHHAQRESWNLMMHQEGISEGHQDILFLSLFPEKSFTY